MNLSLLGESDLGPTRDALRQGSDAIFGTHGPDRIFRETRKAVPGA